MQKTIFIYSLSTKEDCNTIRYIGKTDNISRRLKRHLSNSSLKEDSLKTRWLLEEIQRGHTPIIEIIDEVPDNEWCFWEQYWIEQFKVWGYQLMNSTIGGGGKFTPNVLNKMRETRFNNDSLKYANEIKKFKITQREDIWFSEIPCPECSSKVVHTSKTRAVALRNIKRFQNESRTCSDCAYKKRTGNGNIFFGKTHTKEVKEHLKNIMNKKAVIMLSLDGKELLEFSSLREAARQTKIHRGSISNCCKNIPNYNTAGSFKWKFRN